MKSASLSEIKKELAHCSQGQLIEACLRMAKFKKVNKELLTYILFEAADEGKYIEGVKADIEQRFEEMPFNSLFFTTKYIRKTLRITKQFIQYSTSKQTEIELLLYFCAQLKNSYSHWRRHKAIEGIFERQVEKVIKELDKLHEDLQYDYRKELEKLLDKS